MSEEKPLDKLIAIEWDIIHDLQKQLDGEISHTDMVKISNSLAYHVNTLNKLLAEIGEKPAREETLGQLVVKLPKKFRDVFVRRMRKWIRKPSSAR